MSKILLALVACEVILAAGSAGWTSTLAADERHITVLGTGEVLVKPTRVEIDFSAVGAAELTADAAQKYRDSLRRTTQAFEKLEMKDLKIEARELSFANSAPGGDEDGDEGVVFIGGGGGVPAAAKPQIHISRSMRLVVGGIEKQDEATLMETIGTLLDTARDSGATVGQNSSNAWMAQVYGRPSGSSSMVTFVVGDADEHYEEAHRRAFAAAKSRATRLAKLAGTKLGEVLSIEEAAAEQMVFAADGNGGKSNGIRLTSDKLGDIPVRVTLQVRFLHGSQKGQPSNDVEEDGKP